MNGPQHRNRARAPVAALLVLATFVAYGLDAGSAAAAGCGNSWTNPQGGSWFDAGSWSRGTVPEPGEGVCIDAAGTYTVSLAAAAASVESVTLGDASGTATLALTGGCAGSALLSTASGLLVGTGASLTMGGDDGCGSDAAVEGPVFNRGRIVTLGESRFSGNLTNEGTFGIDADTAFAHAGSTLDNAGRLELERTLHVTQHTDVRNESGAILAAGAGELLESGGKFFEGAGAISGTQPVVVEDGNLIYAGGGQSTIVLRGDSGISGPPHHGVFTFPRRGQTLRLQGTCSAPASVVSPPFTNRGTIALEAACGGGATLGLGGGTLENRGTIDAEAPGHDSLSIKGGSPTKATSRSRRERRSISPRATRRAGAACWPRPWTARARSAHSTRRRMPTSAASSPCRPRRAQPSKTVGGSPS